MTTVQPAQSQAVTRSAVMRLLRDAVLAPSSHNTQPWRFEISGGRIALFADRSRSLPINDPADRELTISCGCALLNLRVAAAHHGHGLDVEECPDPIAADLLATVQLSEPGTGDPDDACLAPYLAHRRTHRGRMTARRVETPVINQLVSAARREGAFLLLVQVTERGSLTALVEQGDREQWSSREWRRELAGWMRPRKMGDGLIVPDLAVGMVRWVIRRLDAGRRVAATNRRLLETAPLLAVLATPQDDKPSQLAAGQALERVLLTACRNGLQASYFNQAVQIPALREKLQAIMGSGYPQIVLRFGYPVEEPPVASRRPLAAVVTSGEA